MRRAIVAASVVVLAVTSSCGSNHVRVSKAAVAQIQAATHMRMPADVELRHDDGRRFAERYGLDEDAVVHLAPTLDKDPFWKSSVARLTVLFELMENAPKRTVADTLTNLCGGIDGSMTPDDMLSQVYGSFASVDVTMPPELMDGFRAYSQDMATALDAKDSTSAVVVLTCYLADEAVR